MEVIQNFLKIKNKLKSVDGDMYSIMPVKENNGLIVIFSIILIVFNPIFPIRLNRELWLPIDLITAAIYFYHYIKVPFFKSHNYLLYLY